MTISGSKSAKKGQKIPPKKPQIRLKTVFQNNFVLANLKYINS